MGKDMVVIHATQFHSNSPSEGEPRANEDLTFNHVPDTHLPQSIKRQAPAQAAVTADRATKREKGTSEGALWAVYHVSRRRDRRDCAPLDGTRESKQRDQAELRVWACGGRWELEAGVMARRWATGLESHVGGLF